MEEIVPNQPQIDPSKVIDMLTTVNAKTRMVDINGVNMLSIYDTITTICNYDRKEAANKFKTMLNILNWSHVEYHTFPSRIPSERPKKTPVASASQLLEIIQVLNMREPTPLLTTLKKTFNLYAIAVVGANRAVAEDMLKRNAEIESGSKPLNNIMSAFRSESEAATHANLLEDVDAVKISDDAADVKNSSDVDDVEQTNLIANDETALTIANPKMISILPSDTAKRLVLEYVTENIRTTRIKNDEAEHNVAAVKAKSELELSEAKAKSELEIDTTADKHQKQAKMHECDLILALHENQQKSIAKHFDSKFLMMQKTKDDLQKQHDWYYRYYSKPATSDQQRSVGEEMMKIRKKLAEIAERILMLQNQTQKELSDLKEACTAKIAKITSEEPPRSNIELLFNAAIRPSTAHQPAPTSSAATSNMLSKHDADDDSDEVPAAFQFITGRRARILAASLASSASNVKTDKLQSEVLPESSSPAKVDAEVEVDVDAEVEVEADAEVEVEAEVDAEEVEAEVEAEEVEVEAEVEVELNAEEIARAQAQVTLRDQVLQVANTYTPIVRMTEAIATEAKVLTLFTRSGNGLITFENVASNMSPALPVEIVKANRAAISRAFKKEYELAYGISPMSAVETGRSLNISGTYVYCESDRSVLEKACRKFAYHFLLNEEDKATFDRNFKKLMAEREKIIAANQNKPFGNARKLKVFNNMKYRRMSIANAT